MATSKEFLYYVLEQLSSLDSISYRGMMGEYLLYYNNTLFGGVYDNRLLIKITHNNGAFQLKTQLPYSNAKPMFMIENLEDKTYLETLIKNCCLELKNRKK